MSFDDGATGEALASQRAAITGLAGVTPFDSCSLSDTPESILFARADLVDALTGALITIDEQRTVHWLLNWDQPMLHTLASIIRKARAAGPVPS